MSGTGRVVDVVGGSVPNTAEPARLVTVEVAGGRWLCFNIPIGAEPRAGDMISWGPHHAWWGTARVAKLSWERDPNAPLT